MTDAMRPLSVETLLAERVWVERLARSLVADDATAADLVQQTWLAAIESPPRSSPRGWLARVVRNAAFQSHRAASRRAAHESAAPPRAPEPSPAETVARAEAHRRVVDAVMALDEPYRTAVLLRFFEGLESADVARRTGVPVETARTRIKRALALLRGRLDRDAGGDGRAWALALAPLIAAGQRGTPAAATGAAAGGGAVMAGTAKAAVIGGLAGVLLGAVVTAGVMGRDAPTTPDETGPSTSALSRVGPAGRSRDAAPGEARPDRSAAAVSAERVASSSSESDSVLKAAADSVAIDVPAPGTGTITGHVRTADGAPVPGITVRGWTPRTAKPRWDRGPAATGSIEAALATAIAEAKWHDATRRDAVTEAAGSYRLDGLLDASYSVSAAAAGYELRLAPGSDGSNVAPGGAVDFVAARVVDVPITIVGADPLPPRVLVRWSSKDRGGRSGWWTAAEPVVRVEPGTWTFVAQAGEDLRGAPVDGEVAVGRPAEPVVLRLEQRTVVMGVVVFDPADEDWGDVHVTARRIDTGSSDEKRASARGTGHEFRFEDLAPGEYELAASLDSRAVVGSATVRVARGLVKCDIVVPRLTAEQALTVSVTGPDGKPVPKSDLDVTLEERVGESGRSSGGVTVSERRDGTLRVALRPQSLAPGPVTSTLVVRSKTYGAKEAVFERGVTQRLELRFDAAAEFRPSFVGADEALRRRLRVTLSKAGEAESDLVYRGQGQQTPFVPPGDYVVKLWIADSSPMTGRVIGRFPVRLHAGENAVPIEVPALHTLSVRVPGAAKGTDVYVSVAVRPDRDVASQIVRVGDGGTALVSDVTAGLYAVHVVAGGQTQEMIVRAPVSGPVTFAPTAIAGLAVTVADEGGLIAKSGFVTGDVITAIDGIEADTLMHVDEAIYRARTRQSVNVDVLRDGRRITLTIDPSAYWGRGTPRGGTWEPVLR
jgi:RNA polymerase sigma-70 factor (ECF subfamily)